MTKPQSSKKFQHLHKEGMIRLENQKLKLEKMETSLDLIPLHNELMTTLNSIFEEIPRTGKIDPEKVFRSAISSLPILDAKQFLIDNLLEALKRGEDVRKTVDRYKSLGLLTDGPELSDSEVSKTDLGVKLEEQKSLWGRIALTVIRIGVNALKSTPKWVEIEPQVMLIGPVPVISFTLKGKGMTIQDLFDTLSESIEWRPKLKPN